MDVKVADEVWIGAALLTREQPTRRSFKPREIIERIGAERITPTIRPGIQVHVNQHAVANLPASPGRYRMLVSTADRGRRLFRFGDDYHPSREGGKVLPNRDDVPAAYSTLIDWYANEYSRVDLPSDDDGGVFRIINTAVNQLISEVQQSDLGVFWSEADIAASHWATLRNALRDRPDLEVHLELSISEGRVRPDLSIIERTDAWADRRRSGGVYAAEFKSFAYRRYGGPYRLSNPEFMSLLDGSGSSLLEQFDRLAEMVRTEQLRGGLMLWRDCFDWMGSVSSDEREQVIAERRQWVRDNLRAPGMRAEYIPVLFPPGVSVGALASDE